MRRTVDQATLGRKITASPSPSRLNIRHLWMLVPGLMVAWMGLMHPVRLLDFWWHLKMGEVIVTSRAIPRVDLFSFTRTGQPFVYQNWLGEVLYYLVYQAGGLPLMIAFNTMLLVLTFVVILHLCLRANSRLHVAVLCSLVAADVLGLYSSVRPQSYSFVLFAAFYCILWMYREGRWDCLWALPVLMVVWVNLHGAFVLGIGLLILVWGTEAIRRAARGPGAGTLSPAALRKLTLILALTVVACLANPEGYRVFAYVRQLQVDPSSQQFVTEWQVPSVKEQSGLLMFFGPFFLALLVFFYTRSPLSLTELGLFSAFAVLALGARRNGIWFGLIVAPMLARHATGLRIPDLRDDSRVVSWLRAAAGRLQKRPEGSQSNHPGLNRLLLACLLLFTVMLSPWVRPHLKVERLHPRLIEESTPVGAMDFFAEHQLSGNIFHPQAYGDYLIWRLWPQQRSFIDGRVHLYDESLVRDYRQAFWDEHWESRLAKYDIQYLLLPKDDENSASMINDARGSSNWMLLYEDRISVLFERQP